MITFKFKTFDELTKIELYEILALRADVFVVEQHCFYLDPDGKDFNALHLLGIENDKLVAYLRLFIPNEKSKHLVFGRVLTSSSVRSKGYGKRLIQAMLDYCDNHFKLSDIHCSAQLYLKKFYESFGFKAIGEVYDDAEIPHVKMIK
ncbi:MAG: GNAT family N-acetyltransferase [Coxiellaceae bacterium]|nr:GNAT family N-acetyltransferase [Coxiellaceae bacterium]